MFGHRVKGGFKQVKGKIQETWGWRTHRYSSVLSGIVSQVVGKIQSIYGRLAH